MPTAIDFPVRESTNPRSGDTPASVDVVWPTFGYWVKAGVAFTLGAGVVTVTAVLTWWLLMAAMILSSARTFHLAR